jgi:PAS domain S-box-containing protein
VIPSPSGPFDNHGPQADTDQPADAAPPGQVDQSGAFSPDAQTRPAQPTGAAPRIVFETTPVGFVLLDRDMRVVDMNPAYAAMGQHDLSTVRGRPFYELAPPNRAQQSIHKRVLAGESHAIQGMPYVDRDGKRLRYYDIYYQPVRDADGVVDGMLSTVVEVTERYELDQQKDAFLALASHELRTPVTSIRGFSQLALREVQRSRTKNSRLDRALSIIREQTDHLSRLIADLLNVSQLQSDKLPVHPQAVDLNELVREVVANAQLASPDLECDLDLPADATIVDADRYLIQEVLTILLENAMKYSPESGAVEVKVALAGGEAVTSVRDFGVGIPEDQQGRVFDRFFRATNAGVGPRNGLGLGLFIARSIVERHGGRIWLESTQGVGSTFFFALPPVS